jgi:hypothetical protein
MLEITMVRNERPTKRGYKYKTYLDGELIVESINAEFDTCRALKARGVPPETMVVFGRQCKETNEFKPSLSMSIGKGSQLIVY